MAPITNQGMLRKNVLFVGNPGAGKSTLLNCLMMRKNPNLSDDEKFKSGVSIVQGLTYQFDQRKVGDTTFMDTPGLEDATMREKAAAEITKALKQNGSYQVVFVVTLEGGRVRPQDVTVVNLVLKSAKEIKTYGVIFNKMTKGLMKRIDNNENEKDQLVVQFTLQEGGQGTAIPFPLFLPKMEELDDIDDVTTDFPALEDFLNQIPANEIHDTEVTKIEPDKFEQLAQKLEQELKNLKADKEMMEKKIEEERRRYEERIDKIIAEDKQRHEEELQRVRQQNAIHMQELAEKERRHLEQMESLRKQDEQKHATVLAQMKEQAQEQHNKMQQLHQQQLAQQEQIRKDMEARHRAQMNARQSTKKKRGCAVM